MQFKDGFSTGAGIQELAQVKRWPYIGEILWRKWC